MCTMIAHQVKIEGRGKSGPDWFDVPGTDNKKARRRAKLEQAISKREALLRTLDEAKP